MCDKFASFTDTVFGTVNYVVHLESLQGGIVQTYVNIGLV